MPTFHVSKETVYRIIFAQGNKEVIDGCEGATTVSGRYSSHIGENMSTVEMLISSKHEKITLGTPRTRTWI